MAQRNLPCSYPSSRLSLKLVRTAGSLAVHVVAAIGYTGLSRSCKIENLPRGVPEQQIKRKGQSIPEIDPFLRYRWPFRWPFLQLVFLD